ncbi:MAG: hypothetical protein ACKO2V_07220 [Snowella sp.]
MNNWLQQQGYDTTPALVYLALISLQNNCLGCWVGIYGQSFFENNQPAPVLVIGPDKQHNTVPYLNGIALNNYIFQMVGSDNTINPSLSWGLDSNSSAGNITFYYTSPITYDSNPPIGYTGNWFQGTLQTSATSPQQTFYGAIAPVSDSSAIPSITPDSDQTPDSSDSDQSFWNKYCLDIVYSIYAVLLFAGLGLVVYLSNQLPDHNFEDAEKIIVSEDAEKIIISEGSEKFLENLVFHNPDNNKMLIWDQNTNLIEIIGPDKQYYQCQFDQFDHEINQFTVTDGFPDGVFTWGEIGKDGAFTQYHLYPDGKIVKTYLNNDELPEIKNTTQDSYRLEVGKNLVFETFSPDGTTYEKLSNGELIKQFIDADGDLLQMHYQLDGTVTVTLPKPGEEIKWPEPPVKFIKNDTFPDTLISNISEQTGIPEDEVSSVLQNIQNDPEQKADWDQLIKTGVDNNYFNNPDPDNGDYQQWLQQVKDSLKEASVPPEQPLPVQPQQSEPQKAPETSTVEAPPAQQQENPFQQQQKIGGEQPQANPDPSAQEPVQSSQAKQIQNANTNLGDETSPAPVQQSPSEGEQTSPDTEEKSQFPEEEEGE